MKFIYRKMSLRQIADDLLESMSDLLMNAGEYHLEPVLVQLHAVHPGRRVPSQRLICLMEALHSHERYPFAAQSQALMRAAAREIQKICYPGTNLSLQPTGGAPCVPYGLGKSVSRLLLWGGVSGRCG